MLFRSGPHWRTQALYQVVIYVHVRAALICRSLTLGRHTRVWELTQAMMDEFCNWLAMTRSASGSQQSNGSSAANQDSVNLAQWLFERSWEDDDDDRHWEPERDDEEDSADEQGAQVLQTGVRPQQVHMLLDWAGRREEFDPSVEGLRGYNAVMERWGHLLRHVPLRPKVPLLGSRPYGKWVSFFSLFCSGGPGSPI